MDYQLRLNSGETYTMKGTEINPEELTLALNNQQTTFVNFGGVVVNKHIIIGLFPVMNPVEEK